MPASGFTPPPQALTAGHISELLSFAQVAAPPPKSGEAGWGFVPKQSELTAMQPLEDPHPTSPAGRGGGFGVPVDGMDWGI